MTPIQEVLTRSVAQVLPTKEGLEALMKKKKIRLYVGIDPTDPNLHLGHAVVLRKISQFQELGHEVILLFGTFTARIGDPTGRDQARQPLSERKIRENIHTYRKQAGLILDLRRARIEQNHAWLGNMSMQDIQELASHATVSHLLERDMFQGRKKRGQPIWLHEMLYPLLQGYDSVALDVDLEVGGTDQTFNMLVGRELQRAYHNKEKYVLTTPLLLGPDGRKMSKSLGNTVNLLDGPNEMYGKLMAVRDELVPQYFDLLTDIKEEDVQKLTKTLSPRDLKMKLANTIVAQYHNKNSAEKAEREFQKVFQKKELPTEIEEVSLPNENLSLEDLLVRTRLASSKSHARRLVEQGGVKIGGVAQRDAKKHVASATGMVLQVGKRKFLRITQ